MRVLHVMEATIGGTRRHLVDVARGQRERGHEVHLAVAVRRDPDFAGDLGALEREGVAVHRVDMRRELSPLGDARAFRALCGLLRRVAPDLVHTHSSKGGALGRAASLATGVGHRVHTPHTFAFLFTALFGPLRRRVFRSIERRLGRATERIVAVSESEARTFRESGVVPEGRIRVVRNGIDARRFDAATPVDVAALGLDPGRPTTAVIGLVYPAKGQDLALEALASEGCEELQLLVVGPGDSRDLEARAHALGVAARTRFLGARRDVPELLAALDFLLLPSRWEGMPYVVLEAMASARAVVATPVDGVLDLVEDGATGILARGVGAAELAVALRRALALDAGERARLGARGRVRARTEFTLDGMVDRLLEVYAEIA